MIKDFIVAVADGIKLQCSREYWDEEEIFEPRATQLHKLPRTSILNIAKDNTEAERTLARFGYLASISSRTSNKKFTAKRIQDDMTLDRCDEIDVPRDSQHIRKALDVMEKKWSESQKQLYKKKLFDDIQKSRRSASYIDVLYKRAEENGGRIRNIDQMIKVLQKASDERKQIKILRTEIALQKNFIMQII